MKALFLFLSITLFLSACASEGSRRNYIISEREKTEIVEKVDPPQDIP